MRTRPDSAPCASEASTPASAYAPRSVTRPFKPMEPTQSERAEGDPVRRGKPVPADPEQRAGDERGGERSGSPGGKGRTQLGRKAMLADPDELEQRRPTDDRQPRPPRDPSGRLPIEPERPRGRDRGAVARDAGHKRG